MLVQGTAVSENSGGLNIGRLQSSLALCCHPVALFPPSRGAIVRGSALQSIYWNVFCVSCSPPRLFRLRRARLVHAPPNKPRRQRVRAEDASTQRQRKQKPRRAILLLLLPIASFRRRQPRRRPHLSHPCLSTGINTHTNTNTSTNSSCAGARSSTSQRAAKVIARGPFSSFRETDAAASG